MFKAIANYFTTAGWLLLPPSFMAYDKQQHGILTVFITCAVFFSPLEIFKWSILTSAIVCFLVNTLVAWGIEYYQKWFTTDRHFDPNDALVMMAVNVILLVIFMWRVSTVTEIPFM